MRLLRTVQFAEDAVLDGNLTRPEKVIEMNNFYAPLLYAQAEIIRVAIHTLLGEEKFQQGMKLYVERHDAQQQPVKIS